jgi:hypothetical protein
MTDACIFKLFCSPCKMHSESARQEQTVKRKPKTHIQAQIKAHIKKCFIGFRRTNLLSAEGKNPNPTLACAITEKGEGGGDDEKERLEKERLKLKT